MMQYIYIYSIMFLHTCQKIEVTPLPEQAPFHLPATDRARHMQPEGPELTVFLG